MPPPPPLGRSSPRPPGMHLGTEGYGWGGGRLPWGQQFCPPQPPCNRQALPAKCFQPPQIVLIVHLASRELGQERTVAPAKRRSACPKSDKRCSVNCFRALLLRKKSVAFCRGIMCVCMTSKAIKSCSNCEFQQICVCVFVICTFRGGSLCSVGLDASFGSGLLRPLCGVVSLPSAESEPLQCAG